MIWATRSRSQSASTRSSREVARSSSVVARPAPAVNSPATARASSARSTGSRSSSSEPASRRDRSSRSTASFWSRSTCSRIVARNSCARLLVEVLVLEQLHEPAEREDRRAQLVRGVGDELAPRAVHARELLLHLVERARELAELVLGVDGQRLDEVCPPPPAAPPRSSRAHAARQRARHQLAAQQRDHQRDARSAISSRSRTRRTVSVHVAEVARSRSPPSSACPVEQSGTATSPRLPPRRSSARRRGSRAAQRRGRPAPVVGVRPRRHLVRVGDHVEARLELRELTAGCRAA